MRYGAAIIAKPACNVLCRFRGYRLVIRHCNSGHFSFVLDGVLYWEMFCIGWCVVLDGVLSWVMFCIRSCFVLGDVFY